VTVPRHVPRSVRIDTAHDSRQPSKRAAQQIPARAAHWRGGSKEDRFAWMRAKQAAKPKPKAGRYPGIPATVERMKAEIMADVRRGRVPRLVASFSELHNYVDANGYGGAFERKRLVVEFWNEAQSRVNAWIQAGGILAGVAQ